MGRQKGEELWWGTQLPDSHCDMTSPNGSVKAPPIGITAQPFGSPLELAFLGSLLWVWG